LAGFGLAAESRSDGDPICCDGEGSVGYRAPELLSQRPTYTNKVDIWALGCILYELSVGYRAFSSDMDTYMFTLKMRNLDVELDESFSETCKKRIKVDLYRMLAIEPQLRPSAIDLLEEFSRHFESTQLNDGNIESPVISIQHSFHDEPNSAENYQASNPAQTPSQNSMIDPLISLHPYYPDRTQKLTIEPAKARSIFPQTLTIPALR
jgi:serine/threonine protein kinase